MKATVEINLPNNFNRGDCFICPYLCDLVQDDRGEEKCPLRIEEDRMQIKVFRCNEYNETEINEWLKENPKVSIVSVTHQPMFDYYTYYSPPQICNQWIATTVAYKEEFHV